MGVFAKKGDAEEPGGGGTAGLHLDLEERYCTVCRRAVLPWETACPVDGGAVALLADLPSSVPPPPAHLLDEPAEDADPS